MTKPKSFSVGVTFHHVDCGYNLEIVDVKYSKGTTIFVLKYLDRDKANFNATYEYLAHMFTFDRFVFN
jgi:hypothetical protein